eukprot:m.128170 g.128170  ORF g.128170 m.128170 type:complete len:177 (+) comp17421_c0_seq1:153-683(+)
MFSPYLEYNAYKQTSFGQSFSTFGPPPQMAPSSGSNAFGSGVGDSSSDCGDSDTDSGMSGGVGGCGASGSGHPGCFIRRHSHDCQWQQQVQPRPNTEEGFEPYESYILPSGFNSCENSSFENRQRTACDRGVLRQEEQETNYHFSKSKLHCCGKQAYYYQYCLLCGSDKDNTASPL